MNTLHDFIGKVTLGGIPAWAMGGAGIVLFLIAMKIGRNKTTNLGAELKWFPEMDVALPFAGKGVRRVPIEYFPPEDMAKARTWLAV
jgi:hypothetical protein